MTPEDIARVAHEANRAVQYVTDDPAPSPAWDEAPRWQRDSAIDGVCRALNGETPEELHESWCEFKRLGAGRTARRRTSRPERIPASFRMRPSRQSNA